MPEPTISPLPPEYWAALGRIPSGLSILTVRDSEVDSARATGMLASWVQQAGFDPPMVTVALARTRFVLDWARASGRFVLNTVPAGNKAMLRHFGKGFGPDDSAFEGVGLARPDEPAGPVLAGAMSYLVVEVAGEVGGGDHVVLLGKVVGGGLIDEDATPMVHVRGTGKHY